MPHRFTDSAIHCLNCALNARDSAAIELGALLGAQTATGVLAAIFLAPAERQPFLIDLARTVISAHRLACDGGNGADCGPSTGSLSPTPASLS